MAHQHHTTSDDDVRRQLQQLYHDLLAIIERDPEQEILGIALPVVDWVVAAARDHLSGRGDGFSTAMVDLISPDTCGGGVPVRALDAWLVVGQLLVAVATPSTLVVAE